MKGLSRKIIFRLSNIHPVSWQNHLEDFLLISHFWEDFSLNGSGFIFNSINDGNIKKVETGVNLVANEDLRLLNKSGYLSRIFSDDNTIFSRVLNLSDHNGSLTPMALVIFHHLVQRIMANDI